LQFWPSHRWSTKGAQANADQRYQAWIVFDHAVRRAPV
jgi:hypothetical protein